MIRYGREEEINYFQGYIIFLSTYIVETKIHRKKLVRHRNIIKLFRALFWIFTCMVSPLEG